MTVPFSAAFPRCLRVCNGAALGVPLADPAFGALTAANGIVRTESGKLSLSFDVRFGCSVTCEDVLAKIEQHTSDAWQAQNIRATDGFLLDPEGRNSKENSGCLPHVSR